MRARPPARDGHVVLVRQVRRGLPGRLHRRHIRAADGLRHGRLPRAGVRAAARHRGQRRLAKAAGPGTPRAPSNIAHTPEKLAVAAICLVARSDGGMAVAQARKRVQVCRDCVTDGCSRVTSCSGLHWPLSIHTGNSVTVHPVLRRRLGRHAGAAGRGWAAGGGPHAAHDRSGADWGSSGISCCGRHGDRPRLGQGSRHRPCGGRSAMVLNRNNCNTPWLQAI